MSILIHTFAKLFETADGKAGEWTRRYMSVHGFERYVDMTKQYRSS